MPLSRAAALLALLSLPVLLHAAPTRFIANLDAGKAQTLVLYGTSETQFGRWADTTPGHGGLSDWLAKQYGPLATVINSGMAGRASNTGLANLAEKVLAHHPDTVLLEFAVNDANHGYKPEVLDYGITVEKARANLEAMIDQILAAAPGTEIILQTMNVVVDAGGHAYATQRPELDAYYQVWRDVAAARHLLLIDHEANWRRLREENPALFATYMPEGLHPTAPGSLAITLPAVEKALRGEDATATPAADTAK